MASDPDEARPKRQQHDSPRFSGSRKPLPAAEDGSGRRREHR